MTADLLTIADGIDAEHIVSRVNHLYDDRDWDRLHDVYTDDVEVDATRFGAQVFHGVAGVHAAMQESWHPVAHHVAGAEITDLLDTDALRVRSQWLAVLADGTAHCGDYDDVLVRTRDGLRIRNRVYLPSLAHGLGWSPGGFSHASAAPVAKADPGDGAPQAPPLRFATTGSPSADRIWALRQLVHCYGHLAKHGASDRLGDVFAVEVRWDEDGHDEIEGLAALAAHHASTGQPLAHLATNVFSAAVLPADGEPVIVSKYIELDATGSTRCGEFHDRAVETAAGWRIRSRRVVARQLAG
jgi:SnoaL-like domain